jgi:hypothetical protein
VQKPVATEKPNTKSVTEKPKAKSATSEDSKTKKPRGRPKKSVDATDDSKPKRKPNIKLLAFQAYCKDTRPKVKEEYPEAKLGEQQKILGEWWKNEEDDTHTQYEQMVISSMEE